MKTEKMKTIVMRNCRKALEMMEEPHKIDHVSLIFTWSRNIQPKQRIAAMCEAYIDMVAEMNGLVLLHSY